MEGTAFLNRVARLSDPKDSYLRIDQILEVNEKEHEYFLKCLESGLTLRETFLFMERCRDLVPDYDSWDGVINWALNDIGIEVLKSLLKK